MADSFSTFPCNSTQALAMLYMNTLDLKGKNPEEIAQIFDNTVGRIKEEQRKIREEKRKGGSDWKF